MIEKELVKFLGDTRVVVNHQISPGEKFLVLSQMDYDSLRFMLDKLNSQDDNPDQH